VAGLCSLPIKKGLKSTSKLLADLSQLLDKLGYDSPASVKKVSPMTTRKNILLRGKSGCVMKHAPLVIFVSDYVHMKQFM